MRVASNNVKIPTNKNKLIINAVLAIKPKTLYLYNIKKITRKKPIIRANIPASIESWPKSGPTVRSSIIFNGAGSAPDLKSKARSVADWKVKSPLICPDPPIIASLTTGALIIFPSNTIASLLPIPVVVALPNLLAPTLSKEKDTDIKKILLSNQNDFTILKKELVNQIYLHPEKNIIVVHDISFKEIYLIYIDEILNVSIDVTSEDYEKYMRLSKIKIANELFNTYDNHIRNKYKIDINYKALKTVKSYFN